MPGFVENEEGAEPREKVVNLRPAWSIRERSFLIAGKKKRLQEGSGVRCLNREGEAIDGRNLNTQRDTAFKGKRIMVRSES